MLDKETRDAVETLNKNLGTKHRVKPYDLNNPDDLKQALELAVAAYRDYCHYAQVLGGIGEDFDESLENYDVETWLELKPGQADALSEDCARSIETAWKLFDELKDRAREHFAFILKTVLLSEPASLKTFGKAYKIEPGKIDKIISDTIDSLDESEYFHPIPENFKLLLKRTDELLGGNNQ
jgi:hypothetical protein